MEQRDDIVKFSPSFDVLVLFDGCIQVLGSYSGMWTNRRRHIDYGLTEFGCVCLGMTYLAKLRRLTNFEKTLGRLYMTVLDFSLLQSVTGQTGSMCDNAKRPKI